MMKKCPKCKKIMEEREFTFVCKDCTVLLKQKVVDISPNEAGDYR